MQIFLNMYSVNYCQLLVRLGTGLIWPNKKVCVFPVTCPQKLGKVGRKIFFFFFLQTLIDVMIIMHDQGIKNHDILLLINEVVDSFFLVLNWH